MGLIFNEKVAEKCNLWVHEQYTKVLFTENLVNNYGLEKKKKGKRIKKKRGCTNAQSKHILRIRLDIAENWKLKLKNTVAK